jgi:predicted glycosyltransferase
MKVLLDILTPKQCRFFSALGRRLEEKGLEVYKTARVFREVVELLEVLGEEAYLVGRYGGATLEGKLEASLERMMELKKILQKIKPDLVVSFSSPEASRVAFGLAIPHVAVNDSPHSTAVAKLSIPLSEILFTPWIIPKTAWTVYGIKPSKIFKYRALDPAAWLKGFKPDLNIAKSLGLSMKKPIVVFRLEESQASYILGMGGLVEEIAVKAIQEFDIQPVIIPRYEEQLQKMSETFSGKALVLEKTVDAVNLLCLASVFVGGGGTMNCEAALLGVPTISCYPGGETYVEKYLIGKGLLHKVSKSDEALKLIERFLDSREKAKLEKKARKILNSMVDPADFIAEKIVQFFLREYSSRS